jgi:LysM repeat protein
MKENIIKSGLTAASAVGFLLLGSCTSEPNNHIFNSRGGNMPPPTSAVGSFVPSAPVSSVGSATQGEGLILNAPPSGPGSGIIIDNSSPINNPPVTSFVAPNISRESYTVKSGDSLWKVANNHGVSVDDLARVNNIPKTSMLKVGQTLSLPEGANYKVSSSTGSSASKSSSVKPGGQYVVQKGDSLSVIAHRNNSSVSAIKSANNLKNDTVYVGQKLTIPGGVINSSGGSSSSNSSSATGDVYTVKKGDSLSVIASRMGTSTSALKQANGLSNDNIMVGQKLVIPSGAKNKSVADKPSGKQEDIKSKLINKPKKVEPKVEEPKEDKVMVEDAPKETPVNPFEEPETPVVEQPVVEAPKDPLADMKLMDVLVVESDTLESLSSDFSTTKELILKANATIKGNEDLKPGMVIKVPRGK